MSRTHKDFYQVKNPSKFKGSKPPYYRSSWELKVMIDLDTNPAVLEWDSEPLKIPYYNPVKKVHSVYVPDFIFVYVDTANVKRKVMAEVKPLKQAVMEKARSKRDKVQVIINAAKWDAAERFCQKYDMSFRVVTEHEIFAKSP